MAEAQSISPTLTQVGNEPLPSVVRNVIEEIQRYMMDDESKKDRPGTIPNMPAEFICSPVGPAVDVKLMELAGEDKREEVYPTHYEIIVPFLMTRLPGEYYLPFWFSWSGNVISFKKVSSGTSDFAVASIKKVVAPVKNPLTGEREPTTFDISTDVKDLPSRPLKKFLQSPLVCKKSPDSCLISSHKMTITWLRSRLDKALNKYRNVEKDVEVIATIKQKQGGPLFLRLHVEKTSRRSDEFTEYDFLFSFCPAFRVSQCQMIVPVLSKLDEIPKAFDTCEQYLWKLITKCGDTSDEHIHKQANCMDGSYLPQTPTASSEVNANKKEATAKEKEAYKASVDRIREMTPPQRRQCEQCEKPASRMLLEYYYQYGHIPEEEMSQAHSFVWEILQFLKESIQEDCKQNDPKILRFVESGSVSEKLKVVQPDEFDVMIEIDLPDSTQCYTFLPHDSFPTGYAICKVRRSKSFSRGLKRCFRKSEELSYCLAPEQLAFGWLYGKLQRAINKYKDTKTSSGADLKLRRGGPALLLEIVPKTSFVPKLPPKISVDLVLALKLGEGDSRYAVAKRAKEEHFYKKVAKELNAGEGGDQPQDQINKKSELARKNLKYLWRISYSAQEKRYLEFVRETQEENGVKGCQNICVMILKTICTREILKREESVICHKLSSYILKTALFHVLAQTDWIHDWKMDCLADRYVDLLDKLSKWKELPHFFFNNASKLRRVFPDEDWCEEQASKNLLDELHNTLKIQLLKRFAHVANSFKECKKKLDDNFAKRSRPALQPFDYNTCLRDVLGGRKPETVIHPPFDKSTRSDEESKKMLVKGQAEDIRVKKAADAERKSGYHSNVQRNLQRPEKDEKKSEDRRRKAQARRPGNFDLSDILYGGDHDVQDFDFHDFLGYSPDCGLDDLPDYDVYDESDCSAQESPDPEFWDCWNDE